MTIVRIHLDGISDLDPDDDRLQKRRIIVPKARDMSTPERKLFDAGLEIFARTDLPGAGLIRSCLEFKSTTSRVVMMGSLKHMRVKSGPESTVTLGASGSVGAGVIGGMSGGLFIANRDPRVGLYGSVDAGVITNIGASVGQQWAGYGTTPQDIFKGPPALMIGVNAGPFKLVSTGAFIVVQLPIGASPAALIGVGLTLGIGVSALPVDIYVTGAVYSTSSV